MNWINQALDNGTDIPDWIWAHCQNWGNARIGWEELRKDEPEYTQLMINSEITFDVVGVIAASKTVTFNVDMPGGLTFDKPVDLKLVNGGWAFDLMNTRNVGGISLYPGPIMIRTDFHREEREFTNNVAHELFHYGEQSHLTQTLKPITPFGFVDWYAMYALEVARQPNSHDSWPSEQRANGYANYNSPIIPPGDVIWRNYG